MSEKSRNIAVGITVIVALALLGAMIVIFTSLPSMFAAGYTVVVRSPNSMDVQKGDIVHLAGLSVGRVTAVDFADPADPAKGVTIELKIDQEVPLPGNTKAFFYTRGVTGQTYIELQAKGEPAVGADGQPLAYLPRDGSAVIPAVREGSSLIPPEMKEALTSFGKLADNLNRLLGEPGEADGPETSPAAGQVTGVLGKLGTTLDAVNAIMGDQANQQNIKQSLENLAKATSAANEAMASLQSFATEARQASTQAAATVREFQELASVSRDKLDELTDKLIVDAQNVSDLLMTMNKAVTKIESGEGSMGKLLNDPQLYNDLLAATRQLTRTLQDFGDMARSWKESGVPIKVR